jgi:YfiH family protein
MLTQVVTSEGIELWTDEGARSDGVLVAFADRLGGASTAPYASLNLAASVGDDPAAVEENRARVARAARFDVHELVLARQTHGCDVIEAGASASGVVGEADVLMSRIPGKVIGILTADCVPVVLATKGAVAVAHAGWRGLVGGAIEVALERLGEVERAWVGPSIHACCYEVGPEVIERFRERGLPVADETHVDPGRVAEFVLRRAGVPRVDVTTDCTSCDARYFSYRRDGVTGRQGAFAGLLVR